MSTWSDREDPEVVCAECEEPLRPGDEVRLVERDGEWVHVHTACDPD